jgi:hypothetical protein
MLKQYRSSRHAVAALRAAAVAVLVGCLLTIQPLPNAQAAGGRQSPVKSACGTWVLEQVNNKTQLQHESRAISRALATPGVVGFSMRVPWSSLAADWSMLDRGLAIARSRGKKFSVRFVAGRFTPASVFAKGAHSFVNRAGERIPLPFSPSGAAGNPVFERAYADMVGRLASWSRAHGVKVVHVPWYGFQWAEIYNGSEVESRKGYSWRAWLEGHRKLAKIALARTGSDLAAEFALSGHWGRRPSGSGEVADALVGIVGAHSPRLIVQGNGMGLFNNDTTNRPIASGKQMYNGNDYQWSSIYTRLAANDDQYLEVYTDSFSKRNRNQLAKAAQRFKSTHCR